MEKKEFLQEIIKLETFYRSFEVSNDQTAITAWYTIFEKEDYQLFKNGVQNHIMTEKFAPTIASIRESILVGANIVNDPNVAWNEVFKLVKSCGRSATKEQINALGPKTNEILKLVGGYNKYCLSTTPDRIADKFIKLYEKQSGIKALLKNKVLSETVKRLQSEENAKIESQERLQLEHKSQYFTMDDVFGSEYYD